MGGRVLAGGENCGAGELNGRDGASARGAARTAGAGAETVGRAGSVGEAEAALDPCNKRFGIGDEGASRPGTVGVGGVVGRLNDEPDVADLGDGATVGFRTIAGAGCGGVGAGAGAVVGREGTLGVGVLPGAVRLRGVRAVGAVPAEGEGGATDVVDAAGAEDGLVSGVTAPAPDRGVEG